MVTLSLNLGEGLGLLLPLDLTTDIMTHLISALCAGGYSTSVPLLTSLLTTSVSSQETPPLCIEEDCGCSPHLRHILPPSSPTSSPPPLFEGNLSADKPPARDVPSEIADKVKPPKISRKVKPSGSEKVSKY